MNKLGSVLDHGIASVIIHAGVEQLPGGGRRAVVRYEKVHYLIYIDREAIAALVTKAANNRSGRSKSGPVVATITARQPQ